MWHKRKWNSLIFHFVCFHGGSKRMLRCIMVQCVFGFFSLSPFLSACERVCVYYCSPMRSKRVRSSKWHEGQTFRHSKQRWQRQTHCKLTAQENLYYWTKPQDIPLWSSSHRVLSRPYGDAGAFKLRMRWMISKRRMPFSQMEMMALVCYITHTHTHRLHGIYVDSHTSAFAIIFQRAATPMNMVPFNISASQILNTGARIIASTSIKKPSPSYCRHFS